MARSPTRRPGASSGNGDTGPRRGYGGSDGREPFDDPREHRLIERRRFQGGFPPTPERYAEAREQWYALPGAVQRPSMDPPITTDRPSPDVDEQSPR